MKVNLIGMILNHAGRQWFDGLVVDDDGRSMPAADSLHALIMEYAKVVNGGKSDLVVASAEMLTPPSTAELLEVINANPRTEGQDTGARESLKWDWFALVEQLMTQLQITQDNQLAEVIGVGPSQISNWRKSRSDLGPVTKLVILDKLRYDFACYALSAVRSGGRRKASSSDQLPMTEAAGER
jgi:hypothetical protein